MHAAAHIIELLLPGWRALAERLGGTITTPGRVKTVRIFLPGAPKLLEISGMHFLSQNACHESGIFQISCPELHGQLWRPILFSAFWCLVNENATKSLVPILFEGALE